MQTFSNQQSNGGLSKQSRTVAIIAMLLLAFSGLLSGFAVGAFVRPKASQASNPGTTPIVQGTAQTVTVTPTAHPIEKIGYPVIDHWDSTEQADNSTTYTLITHVVDQSKDTGHGNPIHATGITCKLWLVQSIPTDQKFSLPADRLTNITNIQQPITGTVQNQPFNEITGLIFFDPKMPQVEQTDPSGQCEWQYRVDTTVVPGDYNLVVLLDWAGQRFNWSWLNITVPKPNQ